MTRTHEHSDSGAQTPLASAWQQRATVVFDFDGTLVRGDCGRSFLAWLLRRNPLRWLAALLASPLLMPGLAMPGLRRWAVSSYLWLATVGMRGGRLERLLERFVAQHRLQPIQQAIAALHEEVSRGHQVVVATGAFQPLAEALLRQLELRQHVAVVGSEAQRWAGGLVVRVQCNRVHKVRQLHAQGFPGPYLRAYSDTWSDYPLLDSAESPVLVNADERTGRRLRERYGRRLRRVVWN